MLTAMSSEADKLKALTIGVDDYLIKPFSPQELLARVHNLLLRYEVRAEIVLDAGDKNTGESVFNTATRAEEMEGQRETSADWLERVAAIMRKQLENSQFHLTDLADQFHLSERQFSRKMKKLTGLSPKKFQQEVALNQAREYLEKGVYSNITAVSHSIGIKNVTRFKQLYEARFGKKADEYFD